MASLFGSDSDTDEDITSTISPSSPSSPSALSNLTQILLSLLSLHNTIHPVDAISNSPVIHPLHKEALEKHAHEVNLDDSLKELYFNSGNNKYKERLGRGDYYVHVAKSSGPPSQHHAKVVTHISSTLGFKVSTDPSLSPDVVVHLSDEDPKQKEEHVKPIKGGTVLVFNPSTSTYSSTLHPPPLSTVNPTVSTFLTQSPSTDSLLTSLSTVSLTLHESLTSPTSITLINCANTILRMGFCVVTSVADKSLISALGTSFKSDLSSALNSVLTRYNVDVTKGEDGGIGFKEVSMREDYRCDIRDGPKVKEMQEEIEALKNNHVVSTIVSLAMNSTSRPPTLRNRHMGNYGRYNFNGGGPSSMYPPPNTRSGSVISLPGCVSQALHADTPHLTTDHDLRPHYINAFYNADDEKGDERTKGQTAFVAGSQFLDVCERMTNGGEGGKRIMEGMSTRPHLGLGDLVMFDARVLHWGTENRWKGEGEGEEKVEEGAIRVTDGWRGIVYANYWREFFQDPKNWDKRDSIFEPPPELK